MQHSGASPIRPFVSIGLLILLTGCGSPSNPVLPSPSGGFGKTVSGHAVGIPKIHLSASNVVGGDSTNVTVITAEPAPAGGRTVSLSSSDQDAVTVPRSVVIMPGETRAAVPASTASVSAATAVTITAGDDESTAGVTLNITPATPGSYSVALQPATVTVQQGHSASAKVVTKVATGFDSALQLKASGKQAGLSAKFNPSTIPAPGTGTSQMTVHVQSTVPAGSYPVNVTASDGATSASSKLTVNVIGGSGGPNAKFKGCWFKQGGHRFQGVDISVGNPGTYPFNAVLYNGASCDPSKFADQIGFGQPVAFGGFSYTFWFTDFGDQTDMSALWTVGDQNSQCINYAVAPSC